LITRRRLILILIRLSSFIKIATTTVIIWLLNKRHKAIAFYSSSLVSLLCQRVESSLPFQTSLQSINYHEKHDSYSMVIKMASTVPSRIRQGARIVKPVLSLDSTEARRRVYNLYKLCYRHIPYISKCMISKTSALNRSQC